MKARLASLLLLTGMMSAPAFGQGCVMCYTSAKGAGANGQKALSKAIITLLVPPVGMMAVLVGFAFRYRNRQDEAGPSEELREALSSRDRL